MVSAAEEVKHLVRPDEKTTNRATRDAVHDFAVDNTGRSNCTAALLNFYNACIADGRPGHIPAGIYKITPGILKFNNGGEARVWPEITTDGYFAVKFIGDASTNFDAPFFEWTSVKSNGNHGSSWPSNAYWYGGCHGGFSITDSSGQVAPDRNGVNLTATWAIKFGYIAGNNLPGSTVYCPLNTINNSNPDPFATSFTRFEGIEGNYNKGFVVNNRNGVGCDSWSVDVVRGVQCESGVWLGIGQGCEINKFSVGSCAGWAFDDGTQPGSTVCNRLVVRMAEFDDVQYGIRLNKSSEFVFDQIRFIHRYKFSPLNTTELYWPRVCIDLSAGKFANVHNGKFTNIINRLESNHSGATLSTLGKFLDCHNSGNVSNVEINVDYADNGNLKVKDSWLIENAHIAWGSMTLKLSRKSHVLYDSLDKGMSFAVGSSLTTVPCREFGKSAILFEFQSAPTYSSPFNLSSGVFTAPREGMYLVSAALPMTLPIGTRVRIGVYSSASKSVELLACQYSQSSFPQTYTLSGAVKLAAGSTMFLTADQTTTSDVHCVVQSNSNEVRFVVSEV